MNALQLLATIHQTLPKHPEIAGVSYDGDNHDGELVIQTKDGHEFVLSSNSLHITNEPQ